MRIAYLSFINNKDLRLLSSHISKVYMVDNKICVVHRVGAVKELSGPRSPFRRPLLKAVDLRDSEGPVFLVRALDVSESPFGEPTHLFLLNILRLNFSFMALGLDK